MIGRANIEGSKSNVAMKASGCNTGQLSLWAIGGAGWAGKVGQGL